jgi:exonuclease SbcC
MYRLKTLEATNFQSFESLSYDFPSGKAILIEGENRTDDGQATNGSGKSSFGEMIYYSLLGSSSTGKRDMKLVRKGEKQATLKLTLTNEYLHQELCIERVLFTTASKPSTLEISINGESQRARYATINDGNKLILELLDISADDLKNYFLVNRKRFVSFFDSPDSAKRSLLARFSNINRVQKVADQIDVSLKDRQEEINAKVTSTVSLRSKIELLGQQIEEAEGIDLYEQKKQELNSNLQSCNTRKENIEGEIATLDAELLKKDKEEADLDKKVSAFNEQIKTLQSIDYDAKLSQNSEKQAKLQEQVDKLKKQKRDIQDEAGSLSKDLQPVLVMLEGVVTCPKCKTEFSVGQEGMDVEEARQLVKETQAAIQDMEKKAQELEQKIELQSKSNDMKELQLERQSILKEKESTQNQIVRIKRLEIAPLLTLINQVQSDISKKKQQRVSLMGESMSLTRKVSELENDLKNLSTDVKNTDIDKWKKQQAELQEQLEKEEKEIETLEGYNQKDKQWKERVNQFYVYLTNKTLTLIQSHCNHYLDSMGSDLRLKFEGFKTLADGKIKESINAVISRGEEAEEDYRCFSGGEQGRLVFSTILTYQELINQKSKSGGLDYLQIDEVLDQVDSMGLGLFIHSLENLDKTIYIISQVKTEAPVENTLLIVKEEGKSRIYKE